MKSSHYIRLQSFAGLYSAVLCELYQDSESQNMQDGREQKQKEKMGYLGGAGTLQRFPASIVHCALEFAGNEGGDAMMKPYSSDLFPPRIVEILPAASPVNETPSESEMAKKASRANLMDTSASPCTSR